MLMNIKRTRKDPFFIGNSYKGLLSHIAVHENKMTEASTHHKQMENFMCSELFMFCIKHRHF